MERSKEEKVYFMQFEVGAIVEGKVTGITKFGAFVDLGDHCTGMVHISEIANTYVNDINDFLKEDQTVKVKVLSVEENKISLSIKKAVDPVPAERKTAQRQSRPRNYGWNPKPQPSEPTSFEDMMARFKASSDEKMSDLKKSFDNKRGSYTKRGSGQSK